MGGISSVCYFSKQDFKAAYRKTAQTHVTTYPSKSLQYFLGLLRFLKDEGLRDELI